MYEYVYLTLVFQSSSSLWTSFFPPKVLFINYKPFRDATIPNHMFLEFHKLIFIPVGIFTVQMKVKSVGKKKKKTNTKTKTDNLSHI